MSTDSIPQSRDELIIGDQKICFDKERTQAAYSSIEAAWSDECQCTPCRNFKAQRGTAFPPSFVDLLRQIGIDPEKESEVYGCYPMPSGRRQYGGWFFFCGVMLESKKKEVTKDGVSYHVLGPGNMPAPDKAFEPDPLALDFTIEIPWVLLDEDPDELYGPPVRQK